MNKTENASMSKKASSLVSKSLVYYIEKKYPQTNLQDIIDDLNNETPYFVKNLQTGKKELVSMEHVKNDHYWLPRQFFVDFSNVIKKHIPDPNLFFRAGESLYKTQHFLKTAVGLPLLGPQKILDLHQRENKKYNRTMESTLLKKEKEHAVIRVFYHENVIPDPSGTQWGAGLLKSYIRLSGAANVEVTYRSVDKGSEKPGDGGKAIIDFEVKFEDPGILKRLFKSFLFNIPLVKKEIDRANEIQAEFNEQILNREKIIKKKTDELKKNQEKMLAFEKKNTELKLRSLSVDLTNTEERERRSIAKDLHDSISQTLGLCVIKLKNLIDSDDCKKSELIETKGYLEQTVDSIRSLTFQLSPPVLHDFGFEPAVEWLVSDICKRYNLKLTFSNHLQTRLPVDETNKINLFRSVRELTFNIIKHARAEHAIIRLFKENNSYYLKVEDDGIGFDINRTFDKKNKSYGLFSVKERIEILGGKFTINSSENNGTTILITIPALKIRARQYA